MKKLSLTIIIVFVHVLRMTSQPLVWGPTTNDAQISITLEGNPKKIKVNEPFNLIFHVKNVSSNATFWVYSPTAPETTGFFVLRVISPKGEDISPKPPKFFGFSGATMPVEPGHTIESKFDLRKVCRMYQPGTYTVVAEREIWPLQGRPPFKARSNPLKLTLVPGKWSPASTNRAKQW